MTTPWSQPGRRRQNRMGLCMLAAGCWALPALAVDPSSAIRVYGGETRMAEQPDPASSRGVELTTEPLVDAGLSPLEPDPTPLAPTVAPPAGGIRNYSLEPNAAAALDEPARRRVPPVSGTEDDQELTTDPWLDQPPAIVNANRAEFRMEVDPVRIHLDESFTLTLELAVPDLQGAGPLKPPRIPGCDLINQHQTDGVGAAGQRVWRIRTRQCVYLAKEPGTIQIPPAEVVYQGRLYRSPVRLVEVEGARSGFAYHKRFSREAAQISAVAPAAPETDPSMATGLEMTATLSSSTAYVGQPVILTLRIRYDSDESSTFKLRPPALDDFYIEELPERKAEATISGQNKRTLDRRMQLALFPLKAGALTIGAAEALVTGKGQPLRRRTEPLDLLARPVPLDSRPLGAQPSALVGRFDLLATADELVTDENAPVRLSVVLSGQGLTQGAPAPTLQTAPGARFYLEKVQSEREGLNSRRTYRYWAVFTQPGEIQPGRAAYRFFDPTAGHWRTMADDWPRIQVAPRKSAPEAVAGAAEQRAAELKPNHVGPHVLPGMRRPAIATPGFWLIQAAGPLWLLGAWGIRRYREEQDRDPKAVRLRRAYPEVKKSLRRLKQHIQAGRIGDFYDGLSRTTTEFLAAKFGLPPAYITADRLKDFFRQYRIPETLSGHFKIALTACEYVRYAAVVLPARDMRALHSDLKSAVQQFEKAWRQEGRRHALRLAGLVLACLMLGAVTAWAGDAELNFLSGNARAERGDWAGAEKAYRAALGGQTDAADVFYNLGNSYFHQGRLGPAILAYQRGLRRAPRDPDLRHNLVVAQNQVQGASHERIATPWAAVYRFFHSDELAWAASAFFYAALLLAGWILVLPRLQTHLRRLQYALAALALIAGGWSALRAYEIYWWPQAIVLVPDAAVYARPYGQGEALDTLPEGRCVRLRRHEQEWVEVVFPPRRQGWMERRVLGRIE